MGFPGREFDIYGLTDLFRVDLCEFSSVHRLYDGVEHDLMWTKFLFTGNCCL